MLPEVDSLLQPLEERRRSLLERFATMTAEQLRHRPATGGWNALEVAEHLLIAERNSTQAMANRTRGRQPRRRLRERLYGLAVKVVLGAGFRVKVPSPKLAPRGGVGLTELGEQWGVVGEEMRQVLARLEPGELECEAFRHPLSGPMDFRAGFGFLCAHFDHHLRQIERLRRSPGYPVAASE